MAAAVATAGCVDLPLVGNLGERLKPLLPAFVRERLFASATADSGDAAPTLPVRLHPRRGSQLAAIPASAAVAVAMASPSPDPQALFEQYLELNTTFDHLRNEGLQALYTSSSRGTARAIGYFKEALKLRPGDRNVLALLAMAEHPSVNADNGSQGPTGAVPELVQPGQVVGGDVPTTPAPPAPQEAIPAPAEAPPAVLPADPQVPALPQARVPFPHG
ncbi:MAG: hypothetical protein KGR26_06470 [Cyanobacteria bacterium REEB65]|nr:hypothetical protein [Cyanobacteria bacterium REEB65]